MNRDKIRAILLAHGFKIPEGSDDLREYVYTATEALLAVAGAPEGWRLVPEHPTPEMLAALRIGSRRDAPNDELCEVRYRALLANAPAQPVSVADELQGYACDRTGMVMPSRCRGENGEDCGCWHVTRKPAAATAPSVAAPTLRLPEPMTEKEIDAALDFREANDEYEISRAIEAEVLRRVKGANSG